MALETRYFLPTKKSIYSNQSLRTLVGTFILDRFTRQATFWLGIENFKVKKKTTNSGSHLAISL